MNTFSKSIVSGVLLVTLVIRIFYTFTVPVSYQLFSLFLAYTACVYLGSALSDSRPTWISVEFVLSLLFFNLAFWGLLYSPTWLALGFMLHGVWDMLHHPRLIKTRIVKWFPPLCAVFDVIVAIFIFRFY